MNETNSSSSSHGDTLTTPLSHNTPAHEPSSQEDENFESLFLQSFQGNNFSEGSVLKGTVVAIDKDDAVIDVGLKSEGRVPLKEFLAPGKDVPPKVGDVVDVFLERIEDKNGFVGLSHEKAKREAAWQDLEKFYHDSRPVEGTIVGRVKGGFTVDLEGAVAFLPGSQVDVRPIRDITPLMGVAQPFLILKMDRARSNIVVSRRSIMEESRAEARSKLVESLQEGQVISGIVKNITHYGAFIDLGGVDGLLHKTDISWKNIENPADVLSVGQNIDVKVIRFNKENNQISLGLKQLTEKDPWEKIHETLSVGARTKGRVTKVIDYGAFIKLSEGIEGLVYISEMSWKKKNILPRNIVSTSEEVEVVVLNIDTEKRRISLSLKLCQENPWKTISTTYPVGTVFEGVVKNIKEFGIFFEMVDGIDGMVHVADISWEKNGDDALATYEKGDVVKVKVLEIDEERERIGLGIKQLFDADEKSSQKSQEEDSSGIKKGQTVTCEITTIMDSGIEVSFSQHAQWKGFIRKSDLSLEKSEQKTSRFASGEKIDAKVISVDRTEKKVSLSIKAREIEEDRQAMKNYGSADSGASLGDILGAAIRKTQKKPD